MLEILEFIFRGFWTWAGTAVLLSLVVGGAAALRLFTVHINYKTTAPTTQPAAEEHHA